VTGDEGGQQGRCANAKRKGGGRKGRELSRYLTQTDHTRVKIRKIRDEGRGHWEIRRQGKEEQRNKRTGNELSRARAVGRVGRNA